MEKHKVYKAKSTCQPVLGIDRAVIVDAEKRKAEHDKSVKTLARQAVFVTSNVEKVVYRKTEHGNIKI